MSRPQRGRTSATPGLICQAFGVPFKLSWKKWQINRVLVQDFVIYAHSELEVVKKLLDKAVRSALVERGL